MDKDCMTCKNKLTSIESEPCRSCENYSNYHYTTRSDQRLIIMEAHSRALACHCECLAMNAENSAACCANRTPPYVDCDYFEVMKKWNLIDGEGNPKI